MEAAVPPPLPSAAAAPAPAKSGGSGVLKIVLMVFGGLFLIAVLIVGAGVFFVKKQIDKASDSVHTDSSGNVTSIDTPFGKIESNKDTEAVVKNLGIEVYPDATPIESGTSSATINNMQIMNAQFETSASMDEVLEFYRGKYPEANVMDTPENKMIMLGERDQSSAVITVMKDDESGRTHIHIAKTTKL
jgi:hypothetical protein